MARDDFVRRGAQARRLLDDPLLRESFERVEQAYVAAWKKADTPGARERLHAAVAIVAKVRGHLQSVAVNGKLAEKQIREIEDGQRRRLRILR